MFKRKRSDEDFAEKSALTLNSRRTNFGLRA
jgi:hypothetical protein